MAHLETILLPDIGDFAEVEIIEILVAPGERIEPEQSLLTLESDKATMEIPAPRGGVIQDLLVKVGDKIAAGSPLMTLATQDAAAPPPAASPVAEPTAASPTAAPTQAAAPAVSGVGETISVLLPDIGDYAEVPVIEILVAPGERVEQDQSILTLESDKATMEVPSPQAGVVEGIAVQLGDKLSQGDLILTLRVDGGGAAAPTAVAPAPAAEPPAKPAPTPPQRAPGEAERRQAPVPLRPDDLAAIGAAGRKAHASPTVRRLARELGVDLILVKGSGPKDRVLREDVQGYVKRTLAQGAAASAAGALPFALPAAAAVDFSKFGPVEVKELSRIQKLSGRHLHRCWLSIPHITQFDEADITELEAFRKAQKDAAEAAGVKLTFLPFLLKAVATALNRMPTVKSSLTPDGDALVMKHYTHIGVAVDTPNGLVVPVVRDVDKKGIYDLARDLMDFSKKARDGKLLPGDMQGGCFTISSLGGIGGTAFTPIVNAPEVAILGVSRSDTKPVWNGKEFVPRLMLPLSLSYDHRVIDGAAGARFTTLLGRLLGDIRTLLL
ncbi:dihydrolipoyllysine-residue acetyltransferase [Candidatus Thiodictyon syntrophicum]|uniref:Acetyltransferase component of pyruvate dehydrogenase complex n=1 Tax=Candidatus Thiodictyon syntrophicum TaxID=1166950 RepID=A0A2K8U3T0_9GAMM|nr:dihydrolipoyllysine-residue acetyltransferase [Candidatus Thiodictyon syntrophicum]AUB79701.1 dihydrolipoyllysine-residue acetyltransferase [Candidatus Thiodictyon syntrophicum]